MTIEKSVFLTVFIDHLPCRSSQGECLDARRSPGVSASGCMVLAPGTNSRSRSGQNVFTLRIMELFIAENPVSDTLTNDHEHDIPWRSSPSNHLLRFCFRGLLCRPEPTASPTATQPICPSAASVSNRTAEFPAAVARPAGCNQVRP